MRVLAGGRRLRPGVAAGRPVASALHLRDETSSVLCKDPDPRRHEERAEKSKRQEGQVSCTEEFFYF